MLERVNLKEIENKYLDIVGFDVFNKFKSNKSIRNGFMPWLLKNYKDNNEDYLMDLVNDFAKNKRKLKNNDIYNYSADSLQQELNIIYDNLNIIHKDKNLEIYQPTNRENCLLLSKHTDWCIADKNEDWYGEIMKLGFKIYIVNLNNTNIKSELTKKVSEYWFSLNTENYEETVIQDNPKSLNKFSILISDKNKIEIINSNNYQLYSKYNYTFLKELNLLSFVEKLID